LPSLIAISGRRRAFERASAFAYGSTRASRATGAAAAHGTAAPWDHRAARRYEIGGEIFLEVVVGHSVPLPAFLAQPHPKPAILRLDILDHPAGRNANAGEEIHH
jgi:hypothetical protein